MQKETIVTREKNETIFSFIIPVYNTPTDYLEKCVKSILSQTITNIEIIIVDDGSDSACSGFCERFLTDRRVKLRRKNNGGVSSARNLGLELASAKWIVFVDPDDWIESKLCEVLNDYLNEFQPDILMYTYFTSYTNEEHPQLLKCKRPFFEIADHDHLQLAILKNHYDFAPLMIGSVVMKVFKRDLLVENKIMFNEHLPKSQDLVFCLYAIEAAKSIYYLNESLYHYRQNNVSVCHKYNSRIFEYVTRTIKATEEFVSTKKTNNQFLKGLQSFKINLFLENMSIDFFNTTICKNYSERKTQFEKIIEVEEFRSAFSLVDLSLYPIKVRILLFLIKNKIFSVLYLWFIILKKEKAIYKAE